MCERESEREKVRVSQSVKSERESTPLLPTHPTEVDTTW